MLTRRFGFLLFCAMVLVAGCKQTAPRPTSVPAPISAASPAPLSDPSNTLARIHWLGLTQISADTNSATFMGIWNSPQSQKLLAQTLNKLAACPWPLLHRPADTNAAALLRPLLEDLVHQECFFYAAEASNHRGALVLCVRLPDDRAAQWKTSLATVFHSLTTMAPTPAPDDARGWILQKHEVPNRIELRRVGGWTVVGAAEDRNDLLDAVLPQIEHASNPFPLSGTNFWLEAKLDLPRFAQAFSLAWKLPTNFPAFDISALGEGTNIHSWAQCSFPRPLPLQLEPWSFPTNLIHTPVTSLTMFRGFKPWLESCPLWNKLEIGSPPNQIFVWGEMGPPSLTFFAAPLSDASNRVAQITDLVLQKAGTVFTTNEDFGFRRKEGGGLEWAGLPFLNPYLTFVPGQDGGFVNAGLFLPGPSDQPPPAVPEKTMTNSNLVWYGWEMSGWRNDAWMYVGQFWRYVLNHAQLPFESPSLLWLKSLSSKLGRCVTEVSLTAPNQLSVDRKSTLGFSAVELHLLADWLESPQFPFGLHTLLAKPEPAGKEGRN